MLGEKLKEARLAAGLTQLQVAQAVQIPRPVYVNFEQNKIIPIFDDFAKICKFLNITNSKAIYSQCIHGKTKCIHEQKCKSSINTYKLSVRLSRRDFFKLTKDNLKKCGFNGLQDFVAVAYHELCNRLKTIEPNQ